jgi:hypothetical protein
MIFKTIRLSEIIKEVSIDKKKGPTNVFGANSQLGRKLR